MPQSCMLESIGKSWQEHCAGMASWYVLITSRILTSQHSSIAFCTCTASHDGCYCQCRSTAHMHGMGPHDHVLLQHDCNLQTLHEGSLYLIQTGVHTPQAPAAPLAVQPVCAQLLIVLLPVNIRALQVLLFAGKAAIKQRVQCSHGLLQSCIEGSKYT